MNTAKRDKIILSVLAIVIIGVIMFYVSIKPCMDEVDNLNAKIAQANQSIQSLSGKSALINDLKKELAELEAQIKEKEGDMANFDDYALYLSDFQDITEGRANSTNITFMGSSSSNSGYYTIVQAKVDFICNYEDLKTIMTALFEKNVHCYDININVSGTDADDATTLRVTFTADYFSRGGAYTSTQYDFTSGRYGLSALFDGVLDGSATGNTNTNTDVNADESTNQ